MKKNCLFIIFFFTLINQIGLADNSSAVSVNYAPNDLYIVADGAYYSYVSVGADLFLLLDLDRVTRD